MSNQVDPAFMEFALLSAMLFSSRKIRGSLSIHLYTIISNLHVIKHELGGEKSF